MERRFYQLSKTALPIGVARLAETVVKRGKTVGIYAPNQARADEIDAALWEVPEFLPHANGAHDGLSPVHISSDAPPKGDVLFVLDDGALHAEAEIICYLFAASDVEIVAMRRGDWKTWREAGVHLTYWAEQDNGAWKKQAEENASHG